MKSFKLTLVLIIYGAGFLICAGQNALPPQPSPNAIATLKYEDTYIKITYCRPHKRGRTVFGGIIPYGKVWRTGANEATEITVTKDIMIAGNRLKAGSYSIFSIPKPDSWTIIFNRGLGLWGAYEYDRKLDVFRFELPVEKPKKVYQPFTIEFEQTAEITKLLLIWDESKISIPIQFI